MKKGVPTSLHITTTVQSNVLQKRSSKLNFKRNI